MLLFNTPQAFVGKQNHKIQQKQVLVVAENTFVNLAVVEQLKGFGITCEAAFYSKAAFHFIQTRLQHKNPYELIMIDDSSAPPMLAVDICEFIQDHNSQGHNINERVPKTTYICTMVSSSEQYQHLTKYYKGLCLPVTCILFPELGSDILTVL